MYPLYAPCTFVAHFITAGFSPLLVNTAQNNDPVSVRKHFLLKSLVKPGVDSILCRVKAAIPYNPEEVS
jgi:hypothetical protein